MHITIVNRTTEGSCLGRRLEKEGIKVSISKEEAINPADVRVAFTPLENSTLDNLKANGLRIIGTSKFSNLLATSKDYKKIFLDNFNIPNENPLENIKVTIEAWYNGLVFVKPYFVSFIDDRFMNRNLGAFVDCAGFTMGKKMYPCKLFNETFAKIEKAISGLDYIGPIRIDFDVLSKNDFVAR